VRKRKEGERHGDKEGKNEQEIERERV